LRGFDTLPTAFSRRRHDPIARAGIRGLGELWKSAWETTPHPTRTTEATTETTDDSLTTVTIKTDKDDPLSYIVEEYLGLYNELLNDENQSMEPHYYFLYDLDGNGTAELLLAEEVWDQIYLYSVYTIRVGVAVHQKEFRGVSPWHGSPPVLFKNGTIRAISNDGRNYYYYRFEDGRLKLQTLLYLSNNGGYGRMDGWDGDSKKITGTTFRRLQKEFEGDGQVVELDWKPLAEYGR